MTPDSKPRRAAAWIAAVVSFGIVGMLSTLSGSSVRAALLQASAVGVVIHFVVRSANRSP